MHYVFESVFVGIYCVGILALLLRFMAKAPLLSLLFLLGFIKHLSAYYLQIQSLYCNRGDACVKVNDAMLTYRAKTTNILMESMFEGFSFLIIGLLVTKLGGIQLTTRQRKLIFAFVVGSFMHIVAEKMGIHKKWCKTTCKPVL